MDDRIRFLRPLYNDDIDTTDRRFELVYGTDDEKIALVETELQRLGQLAELSHPLEVPVKEEASQEDSKLDEIRARLKQNRPRRKYFGL
jgi:hypothetical protein